MRHRSDRATFEEIRYRKRWLPPAELVIVDEHFNHISSYHSGDDTCVGAAFKGHIPQTIPVPSGLYGLRDAVAAIQQVVNMKSLMDSNPPGLPSAQSLYEAAWDYTEQLKREKVPPNKKAPVAAGQKVWEVA